MCITPEAIVTQNPESGMGITNTYFFAGDPDIENVTVGAGNEVDGEFTIIARQDKKVRRRGYSGAPSCGQSMASHLHPSKPEDGDLQILCPACRCPSLQPLH